MNQTCMNRIVLLFCRTRTFSVSCRGHKVDCGWVLKEQNQNKQRGSCSVRRGCSLGPATVRARVPLGILVPDQYQPLDCPFRAAMPQHHHPANRLSILAVYQGRSDRSRQEESRAMTKARGGSAGADWAGKRTASQPLVCLSQRLWD